MVIYKRDLDQAREISEFGSRGALITPLVKLNADALVHRIRFDPHSLIGMHQAVGSQLFIVSEGSGWVRTNDEGKVYVSGGDMVYWMHGEWHESGTEQGMTVIIIEGQNPGQDVFSLPDT